MRVDCIPSRLAACIAWIQKYLLNHTTELSSYSPTHIDDIAVLFKYERTPRNVIAISGQFGFAGRTCPPQIPRHELHRIPEATNGHTGHSQLLTLSRDCDVPSQWDWILGQQYVARLKIPNNNRSHNLILATLGSPFSGIHCRRALSPVGSNSSKSCHWHLSSLTQKEIGSFAILTLLKESLGLWKRAGKFGNSTLGGWLLGDTTIESSESTDIAQWTKMWLPWTLTWQTFWN